MKSNEIKKNDDSSVEKSNEVKTTVETEVAFIAEELKRRSRANRKKRFAEAGRVQKVMKIAMKKELDSKE